MFYLIPTTPKAREKIQNSNHSTSVQIPFITHIQRTTTTANKKKMSANDEYEKEQTRKKEQNSENAFPTNLSLVRVSSNSKLNRMNTIIALHLVPH